MKVGGVQVVKTHDDAHDIKLDDVPAYLEKRPSETIRSGSPITRHVEDCVLDLLFRNGEG